jgi:porphobilinogen deaminase
LNAIRTNRVFRIAAVTAAILSWFLVSNHCALGLMATAQAVTAERAFLWHLGGGCTVPIAALAQCQGAALHMQGLVSSPDGSQLLRQELRGPGHAPAQLGERLAAQMRASGAGAILEAMQDGLYPLSEEQD